MKIIYFSPLNKYNSNIFEGGKSRDSFIQRFVTERLDPDKIISANPIFQTIWFVMYLNFMKNTTFVFHYPSFGFPIYSAKSYILFSAIFRKLVLLTLSRTIKRNKVIMDIADLKYEQFDSMNLYKELLPKIKKFEDKLFSLNIFFVFSSTTMRLYSIKKYNLKYYNTLLIQNTTSLISIHDYKHKKLDKFLLKDSIKFIYSGSLNKGRQIEDMILNFPTRIDFQLLLIGPEGEWLSDYKLGNNILYLAELKQYEVQKISTNFDVGVIPYDETKLYYNLAYPVKISSYITAGITFLSTPISESMLINKSYGIGFLHPLNEWHKLFSKIDRHMVNEQKKIIKGISKYFSSEYAIETINIARIDSYLINELSENKS